MDRIFLAKSDLDLAIMWIDKNEPEKAKAAINGAKSILTEEIPVGSLDEKRD